MGRRSSSALWGDGRAWLRWMRFNEGNGSWPDVRSAADVTGALFVREQSAATRFRSSCLHLEMGCCQAAHVVVIDLNAQAWSARQADDAIAYVRRKVRGI